MKEPPAAAVAAGLVARPDDDLAPPDPERIVDLLARVLARLHDLPVVDTAGPVGPGPTPVLASGDLVQRARRAVADGWRPDPAGPYAHMAADRLVQVLDDGAAAFAGAGVLTHGRPSVERLRVVDGAPALVDWDGAAVADPYRDLAAAAQDLARTIGPMLVPVLFERYRLARPTAGDPDPRRLDWYVLASQFSA